ALDHRQLYSRPVVDGELVEAGAHGPALLQPPDALLDHRPTAVRLPVEPTTPVVGSLVLPTGDDVLDPVAPQPAPDPRGAVPLVARQLHRPAPRPAPPVGDADLVMTRSNCGLSCLCPAVTSTARGRPLPSVTRCSLVPKPPRLLPRAWSAGSEG